MSSIEQSFDSLVKPDYSEEEVVFPLSKIGRLQESFELGLPEKLIEGWLKEEKEPSVRAKMKVIEEQIQKLIENGDIALARKALSPVPEGLSEQLDRCRRLLAEPVITSGGPASGKNFRKDFDWIEQHSRRYKGLWIAIKDGELLGSNRSRLSLQRELERKKILRGATFFKVEE